MPVSYVLSKVFMNWFEILRDFDMMFSGFMALWLLHSFYKLRHMV